MSILQQKTSRRTFFGSALAVVGAGTAHAARPPAPDVSALARAFVRAWRARNRAEDRLNAEMDRGFERADTHEFAMATTRRLWEAERDLIEAIRDPAARPLRVVTVACDGVVAIYDPYQQPNARREHLTASELAEAIVC